MYPQVFAGWIRELFMHMCLHEQEKTEVSVDLSNCIRVATDSCHFEKLIALHNLSFSTVKIETVYLEQGSFLGFFIHTLVLCKVYPCKVCIRWLWVKPLLIFFSCIHLVLSSFCSPKTMACLLSDFCHLTLFLINVLSVNENSTLAGRRENEACENVAGRLQIPLCLGSFMYFYWELISWGLGGVGREFVLFWSG